MSSIIELYGNDYYKDNLFLHVNNNINTIANNISNREFNFKINNMSNLWESNKMHKKYITMLIDKINKINPDILLHYLDINTNGKHIIPYVLNNTAVEYFCIEDKKMNKAYFIYITMNEVHAY